MYEVFQWIYGNKIHNTDGGGNDIEFSFPVTGDEDTAAGNCLCSMDWNRRARCSDRRNRAFQRTGDGCQDFLCITAADWDRRTESDVRTLIDRKNIYQSIVICI